LDPVATQQTPIPQSLSAPVFQGSSSYRGHITTRDLNTTEENFDPSSSSYLTITNFC
jgi:hypothetical protein